MFVTTLDPSLEPQLIQELKEQGFELTTPPHTYFSAKKKGVSCTFYRSGKLVVQGKEIGPFIEFYLEPKVLKNFSFTYADLQIDTTPRIGIDESGKGDFFGPLCIAGVFAKEEEIAKLKELGVKDSKTLSHSSIVKIAAKIRQDYIHHVVKINPIKYNQLIVQFGNLNRLLAWGHATVIEQLVTETTCRRVIVDQFGDEQLVLSALKRKHLELDLKQAHRAEEDLVVAAASILARWAFTDGIEKMEQEFKLPFPKGASQKTILAGKEFVKRFGRDHLNQVAKIHFKTLDSI